MCLKSHGVSEAGRPAAASRRFAVVGGAILLLVVCQSMAAHAQNFGEWQPAVSVDPGRLTVNSPANDGCPIESPDGHLLFLASDRSGDLDIWVAARESDGGSWAPPERLLAPINTPASEFCPTPLPGNVLLFVSTRGNPCGSGGNSPDIYATRLHPVRGWLPPVHLGCEVNSTFQEFSPSFVEADGVTLLYFSSNRDDGVNQKIYVSEVQPDGDWGPAAPVTELNAEGAQDARPNVRKDGLEIVFDSTRDGGPPEIYTAFRDTVFEPWSAPQRLSTHVNATASAETRASISRDGRRLYFGSTRANQSGDRGSDVFVSSRSGPGDQ
jgi:hypothetical protein